jgi:hypothetical protein
MLTSAYPKRLFGDEAGVGAASATRPLLVAGGARVLLIIFIVVGVIDAATGGVADGAGHPEPAASTHR